jgi:TolB-like protein/Tfp pilus assembly protein PilF
MKSCPQCQRVYKDDALRFCRTDGSPLVTTNTEDLPTAALRGLSSDPLPISRPFGSSAPFSASLKGRSSRKAIDSLAVLPFTNVGANVEMEYFSDGVTESIINALSKLPKLRVVARSVIQRYRGQEIDPLQVGQELDVRAVLAGRVQQSGDALMVGTELIDVTNGAQLWGERYNRKLADVFVVQEEIARKITERLRIKLAVKHKKELVKRYTEDPEAYQAYLKGRYYWEKRSQDAMQRAIQYFQQAIDIDPGYAAAYSGLADCFNAIGWFRVAPAKDVFPRAKAAAAKALEIDDKLAEAHTSLAYAKFLYDWDWRGAERGFKRALKLNPKYATTHQWYSVYLWAMGRFEESVEHVRRAQELDPLSLVHNLTLGVALYFARRYEESVEQFKTTLEIEPRFYPARMSLSQSFGELGRFGEAIAEAEAARATEDLPVVLSMLGCAYAIAGREGDALRIIDELQERSKTGYVSSYEFATIYADMGRGDDALEWFKKALEERASWMVFLNSAPRFEFMKSTAGYIELLDQLNFPA